MPPNIMSTHQQSFFFEFRLVQFTQHKKSIVKNFSNGNLFVFSWNIGPKITKLEGIGLRFRLEPKNFIFTLLFDNILQSTDTAGCCLNRSCDRQSIDRLTLSKNPLEMLLVSSRDSILNSVALNGDPWFEHLWHPSCPPTTPPPPLEPPLLLPPEFEMSAVEVPKADEGG